MALAVDAIDICGPSNEMRCQLQLKKNKVTAVLSVYITAKGILPALHNYHGGAL